MKNTESLYDMILRIYELWKRWTGSRDSETLIGKANQARSGLEEQVDRDARFHGVIAGFTPSMQDAEEAFWRNATHLQRGSVEAQVELEFRELKGTMARKKRATDRVDPSQLILLGRQEVFTTGFNLVQLLLGEKPDSTAQLNAQAFSREITTWRDESRVDSAVLEEMEYLFGKVYLYEMFSVFAVNESLPENVQVPLDMLVLCATYKYGRPAEVIGTSSGPREIFRCLYCNYGPCACKNRPPAAGVANMKKRQNKYPTEEEEYWQEVRRVSTDQLDMFMRVVYMLRNILQGLTRAERRKGGEFSSEFAFGVGIVQHGGIAGFAPTHGQLVSTWDRRFARAMEHAWKDIPENERPTNDEDLLLALADPNSPLRRKLPPTILQQIFRHAAADPIVWGPLAPITYGLSFRRCIETAMRHFEARDAAQLKLSR